MSPTNAPTEGPARDGVELAYLKQHHHITESAIGLAILALSRGNPGAAMKALKKAGDDVAAWNRRAAAPAPFGAQSGPRVSAEEGASLEDCLACAPAPGAPRPRHVLEGIIASNGLEWPESVEPAKAELAALDAAAPRPLVEEGEKDPEIAAVLKQLDEMLNGVTSIDKPKEGCVGFFLPDSNRIEEAGDRAAALIRRLAGERDEAIRKLQRLQDGTKATALWSGKR